MKVCVAPAGKGSSFLAINEMLVHLSHSISGTIIPIHSFFPSSSPFPPLFLMSCLEASLQSSRSIHSATPAPQSPEMTALRAVIHYCSSLYILERTVPINNALD